MINLTGGRGNDRLNGGAGADAEKTAAQIYDRLREVGTLAVVAEQRAVWVALAA